MAFLISPDAKMEDCSFLHSSTNFSVFILTCQIICMTVLHLFVTIFVLTFLFPCFDFTACNLHSRISIHAVPSLLNTGGRSPACLGCSSPVPPGFPSVLLKELCHYTLHRDIHFHEYQGILCSLLSWHGPAEVPGLLYRLYYHAPSHLWYAKEYKYVRLFLFNSLSQIPEP